MVLSHLVLFRVQSEGSQTVYLVCFQNMSISEICKAIVICKHHAVDLVSPFSTWFGKVAFLTTWYISYYLWSSQGGCHLQSLYWYIYLIYRSSTHCKNSKIHLPFSLFFFRLSTRTKRGREVHMYSTFRPVFAAIVHIVHGKKLLKNVLVCKYEAHHHLLDDLSLFCSFPVYQCDWKPSVAFRSQSLLDRNDFSREHSVRMYFNFNMEKKEKGFCMKYLVSRFFSLVSLRK